jgi:tRNA nucleotidyltransferase (CCA-adding enzyme)
MERLLRTVLARIKPAQDQIHEADHFVKDLQKKVDAAGLKAAVMIGGSTAKGTFLKGDHDIDIFVRFDRKKHGNDPLDDLLAQVVPEGSERVHGSRDYFQVHLHGYNFEMVPVLKVQRSSEAKNVTDMSPLHVAHVAKALKKAKLADEIRLAKQFCKAAKVYGAESYINGFSGHVLDLLLIRYGSFTKLLQAAAVWGDHVVLDPGNHHKDPRFSIDESKRLGPLLLVDPVQPERNAAAALSREKFELFKEQARAFLAKPALKYFIVTHVTPAAARKAYAKKGAKLFLYRSDALEGKEDVVATKLLKIQQHLVKGIKHLDFTVLDESFEYQKGSALHLLLVKDEELSASKEYQGPPVSAKKNAAAFKEKHSKAYVKKGRLYATLRRKYRNARDAIASLVKDEYVLSRCEKIRKV